MGAYAISDLDLYRLNLDGTYEPIDTEGTTIGFAVDKYDANTLYSVKVEANGFASLFRVNAATRDVVKLVDSAENYDPDFKALYPYPDAPLTSWQLGIQQGAIAFEHGPWIGSVDHIGDQLVFTANWNYYGAKELPSQPIFQTFICDLDGKNIRKTGFENLGGVMDVKILADGCVAFMTTENQGWRNLIWGIWKRLPGGGGFAPVISAMDRHVGDTLSPHRIASLRDGGFIWEDYYAARMVGTLRYTAPPTMQGSLFGPPLPSQNQPMRDGYVRGTVIENGEFISGFQQQGATYGFQREGTITATPFATAQDWDPAIIDGQPAGEWFMPAPHPISGALVGKRSNNVEMGIYWIPQIPAADHSLSGVVKVLDEPGVMEVHPYPALTWEEIYGQPAPQLRTYTQVSDLPQGSPFARIKVAGVHHRETEVSRNLQHQGGDVADYEIDDMAYFGVVVANGRPFIHDNQRTEGVGIIRTGFFQEHFSFYGWASAFNEILLPFEVKTADGREHPGIPLHKYRTTSGHIYLGDMPAPPAGSTLMRGPDNHPDTSFQVEIPMHVPVKFEIYNKIGRKIVDGQTWHYFASREEVKSCDFCHLHHEAGPFTFGVTLAANTDEVPVHRLLKVKRPVEYHRDVKPILEAKCVQCHNEADKQGDVDLSDYWKFVRLNGSETGILLNNLALPAQSLRAGLYQKIADGNHSEANPPTFTEINTIGDWIDNGVLVNAAPDFEHVFADALKPSVHIEFPKRRANESVSHLKFSAVDVDSGVDRDKIVHLINGTPYTGTWDWDDEEHIATSVLQEPLPAGEYEWSISVPDHQPNLSGRGTAGNTTSQTLWFTVTGDATPDPTLEEQLAACLADKERLEAELAAALLALEDGQAKDDRITQLEAGLADLAAQIQQLRGN